MELVITLIEVGNAECPNIGTITCKEGHDNILREKAIRALESHFDTEVKDIIIQDNLSFEDVRNSYPLDAEVVLAEHYEDFTYKIKLQQTWVY